jgi:hypothetical protein
MLALGAVFGMVSIPFGCGYIIGNSSFTTCTKVGAVGGVFAFIPTIPATIIACDIYNKTTSSRVSTCMILVTFPLISFGFSLLSTVIGWRIVSSIWGVDFQVDGHGVFAIAAISSTFSYLVCMFVFLRGVLAQYLNRTESSLLTRPD